MNKPAPFLVDDADVPELRNAMSHLVDIGYNETQIRKRLELSDINEIRWRALPIYQAEQLKNRDTLSIAIDLFLLQSVIESDELNLLFDKNCQGVFVRSELLEIDEKGFARARASLFPVGGVLIFSDHAWPKLPHPGYTTVPYDQVMSIGTDSRWLARVTTRRSVGATLDLCSGSGVQAILAASHSQRVLAVDISHRAALCASFNAKVSGTTNVEIVIGDLFEPINGERFDLVTANPPFVPSPVKALCFRDGGHTGEDIQRRIVEGLPHHLAPGGTAHIVTELGEGDGELISDRLRRWLGDARIDIVILRLQVHSAASYAIGHANGDDDFGEFLQSVHDWADNLKTHGYSRIVSVLLTFQWNVSACGPPWTRSEEAQLPHSFAASEIEAIFCAERMARKPNLNEMLDNCSVCRAGLVGLMEARVLGSELRAKAQAQLLGRSLSIIQWLNSVELDVLILLDKPLKMDELIMCAFDYNHNKEAVFDAVGSLLRRGLILLTDDKVDI